MIPGGLAQVTSNWPTDDLMELTIYALGQTITGDIEIYETQVVIAFDLPPALSFLRPMIEGAVRSNATRLLGKKIGRESCRERVCSKCRSRGSPDHEKKNTKNKQQK